jgi:hypothetical protein
MLQQKILSNWRRGILGCVLLLCACDDLERNNPLDPKNPNSERRRVIFAEAFVNDGTPFSAFALAALDSLAATVPPAQLVIVEHHLPSATYADAHALPESADRYRDLIATDAGVPDVFFSGSLARVLGASSTQTALTRYRNAVQPRLGEISHFTIEAKKTVSAASLTIDVTVARLGDRDFTQFAISAIIWEDLGAAGHHHVVRKILPPVNFSGIAAREIKTARFDASFSSATNTERLQVAAIVEKSTSNGKEILQAVLAE